jgi:dihydrofolate reductase
VRKLIAFEMVSLDGYFVDADGQMSWAHRDDAEWSAFTSENATGGGELLFGRVTYQMMASYWPSAQAMQAMPEVAAGMHETRKYVFSRTLHGASWNNSRVVRGDIVAEVRRLKEARGPQMAILGSGSIVAQLTPAGLIDELQIVLTPIALGGGRTLFDGIGKPLYFRRSRTRTFGNGNVLLCYEPA